MTLSYIWVWFLALLGLQPQWQKQTVETFPDGSHQYSITAIVPPVSQVRPESGRGILEIGGKEVALYSLFCYQHEPPIHIRNPSVEDMLTHDHYEMMEETPHAQ